MSVVIIGGHDRMVRQYKEICENHKYKAKVFTQMKTGLDKLIGRPDMHIYCDDSKKAQTGRHGIIMMERR